jgi:hypothetical protein
MTSVTDKVKELTAQIISRDRSTKEAKKGCELDSLK